jgi:hypothetical protein
MHCLGAVADQGCKVVDVESVAGFGHESHPRAKTLLHQVLANRSDRQQHRNRCTMLGRGAVADDEDFCSSPGGTVRRAAQHGERGLEARRSPAGIPDGVQCYGRESGHVPKRRHLFSQQNRVFQTEHPGVGGALEQRRPSPAQMHPERHHHRFAQRIDRRIGDLREALPEVGVKTLGHH